MRFRIGFPACLVGLLSLAWHAVPAACVDDIRILDDLRYEYRDAGDGSPIVLMVPGFTQHNCSPEFGLLKTHFRERGFSVLILDPPQHGEKASYHPLYGWGEDESADLAELVDSLRIRDRHPRMHALGFSIGAKTVIQFAASSAAPPLESVTAVAPPYRVGDINMLLSSDPGKPLEGLISGRYAIGRASYARIAYMVFAGMPRAMAMGGGAPASRIAAVKAPLLMVHGSGDWLIRSNHSVRLFDRVLPGQPAALVVLETGTHAEDMLSRAGPEVRRGLLDVLDRWIDLIDSGSGNAPRDSLQARLAGILDSVPWVGVHRMDPARVSHLDHPTLAMASDGLWYSASREHASLGGVHFAHDTRLSRNRVLIDAAPWAGSGGFAEGLAMDIAATDAGSPDSRTEATLSYARPFGSWLSARRLGLTSGIGAGFHRRILSADLCLLILDFRVNYGEFSPGRRNAELAFSRPFISSPSSACFLGIGYSAFLTQPGADYDRDAATAFLALGPPKPVLGLRGRLTMQYAQGGFLTPGWHPALSLGIGVSLMER
ncbi:MAG TPA: hypothetical protein VJ385_19305 [Fibrobacteria bacterium]|nr:hypothetical protein [Fibrobacteria bacterium]